MWFVIRFPRVVLLWSLLLAAALAPSTHAQSPTGKWLAEQDSQWQTTYRNDVTGAYDKVLADLKKQYVASLEAQLAAASREAKLDDAVAIRSERDRVAAGEVPPDNDPAVLAPLRTLRAGYAKNLAVLATDRAARGKALFERYDAILAQNQTALTKSQRLDEALEIKAKRDQLKSEWLDKIAVAVAAPPTVSAPSAAGTPPAAATPAPAATPKPLAIATTVRPAERMDLHLSGSNGITVYVNNKEVIKGVIRENASKVRVGLREGDVIAVKNADRWDINSLWMSCISSNGQFLFETTTKWTSYIPASEGKWWELKGLKEQKPAEFAPDKQEYVDRVKNSMKETPLHHGAQPIRSTLHVDGGRATYLYYKVTRDDLLPKPDPAPAK